MTKQEVLDYIIEENDDALFRFKPTHTEVYLQELVFKITDTTLTVGEESYSLEDERLKYVIDLELSEINEFPDVPENRIPLEDFMYALECVPSDAVVRLNIVMPDGSGSCECPAQVVYDELNNDVLISNHWEDPEVLEKTCKRDLMYE